MPTEAENRQFQKEMLERQEAYQQGFREGQIVTTISLRIDDALILMDVEEEGEK